MNDYQSKLLDILKWFDELCKKEGLRYYINGGTLLGAMRHHGFIPWDDDIDVGMPRPDYEKLCELVKEVKGKYILETPHSENRDYLYPIGKIYDTETTAIEEVRSKCKRGIFLDIFPADGVGATLEEGIKTYNKFNAKNMFIATRTSVVRKDRKAWKNAAIVLSRIIPEGIVNTKEYICKFDKAVANRDFEASKYIAECAGGFGANRDVFKKDIIFPTREYEFEGLMVQGPNDAEGYLEQFYGNWQELPPVDQRKSGHDLIYIDLNKSFLEE